MASKLMTILTNQPYVWSVAGSDCSGGAGIQADNLTFKDFGVHGCNIITAITAQNSTTVSAISSVDEAMIKEQWLSLANEFSPAVIKIGMLGSAKTANVIALLLENITSVVICDPVMKATNDGKLSQDKIDYLSLLSQVDILTPNISEFCAIFSLTINTADEVACYALQMAQMYSVDIIVTGGENDFLPNYSSDFCVIAGEIFWMHSPYIDTKNTHGTGCSFSSAIAALIALGYSRLDACVLAKAYINQGLQSEVVFRGNKGAVQHCGFPQALSVLPSISPQYTKIGTQFPQLETKVLGLYPVVDSIEWLERCLKEGVKTIQLRVKNLEDKILDNMICKAVALGRQYQARLFINDYWQLAIKHNAYGVHLGQEDLAVADLQAIEKAGLYLGISTHSWYEIAKAHSYKPSYIAIGPIYATKTKVMPFAPQGLHQLTQWIQFINNEYPIVAIGGIDLNNAKEVLATGVGSIAMVRAITLAEDYQAVIRQFEMQFKKVVGENA